MKLIIEIPDNTYNLIKDVAMIKHTTIDAIVNDIIKIFIANLSANEVESK